MQVVWNRQQLAFPFKCCIVLLWNNNIPVLSEWCLHNDMKQFTFLNTLNRYCVERTCFKIFYSGSASSNVSKAVRNSNTTMHMQSCFVIIRFMARGHSLQSFCFSVSAEIFSAVYSLHPLGYYKLK